MGPGISKYAPGSWKPDFDRESNHSRLIGCHLTDEQEKGESTFGRQRRRSTGMGRDGLRLLQIALLPEFLVF